VARDKWKGPGGGLTGCCIQMAGGVLSDEEGEAYPACELLDPVDKLASAWMPILMSGCGLAGDCGCRGRGGGSFGGAHEGHRQGKDLVWVWFPA
jgi:hypothetical protein